MDEPWSYHGGVVAVCAIARVCARVARVVMLTWLQSLRGCGETLPWGPVVASVGLVPRLSHNVRSCEDRPCGCADGATRGFGVDAPRDLRVES